MEFIPGTQAREPGSNNVYLYVEASVDLVTGDYLMIDGMAVATPGVNDGEMPHAAAIEDIPRNKKGWVLLSGSVEAQKQAKIKRAGATIDVTSRLKPAQGYKQ